MSKIVVLNHKMNLTKQEVQNYIIEIKNSIPSDLEVIICPSNIYIPYFEGKYDFKLGSQNIGYAKTGSYTGEVSGYQLKSMGVKYAIIGHSERLMLFKEDGELINKKIASSLEFGITPIVCVGENKEERSLKKTGVILTKQIKAYFKNIEIGQDIIIAYEPIWAIGGNVAASKKDILDAVTMIKELVLKLYNCDIKVLYGGSVNKDNVESILNIDVVDGVLIGSNSSDYQKVNELFKII